MGARDCTGAGEWRRRGGRGEREGRAIPIGESAELVHDGSGKKGIEGKGMRTESGEEGRATTNEGGESREGRAGAEQRR